jgi:hypothetical protein
MSDSRTASCAVLREAGAHQVVPVEDSWYSERTQHPAILVQESCHPVMALCQGCHLRVRREKPWLAWEHDPAGADSDDAVVSTRGISEPVA